MAVTTLSPIGPAGAAQDMVTLQEASALLEDTGHPARTRTLKRWCLKHSVPIVRYGRDDWASWTDLLEIHAKEVDARA
jgi:hypothetical protein